MRESEELRLWQKLAKRTWKPRPLTIDGGSLDINAPCTIIGGRNGAGKSRVLRKIEGELGVDALLINMHHLCEQAMIVLRSRDDIDGLVEEVGPLDVSPERREDIERIIGRNYESAEWYSLDLEPSDATVAKQFLWNGDQCLVPHCQVNYRGIRYSTTDMGLGEFSVHFLFWIIELYRDSENLTLILDEPDAYLPPVGSMSLLARLLSICLERGWNLVIATHSEEIIAKAIEERVFSLVRLDAAGQIVLEPSSADDSVGSTLLARPPIDRVLFCEDESARHLTEALIRAGGFGMARATTVVWGGGDGFMRKLHPHLPKPPRPAVKFAYVFDGDQGSRVPPPDGRRWGAICLPTDRDPDTLFMSLAPESELLSERLGVQVGRIERFLDSIEGADSHDWVNRLGDEFGREIVLSSLASIWVEKHADLADAWVGDLAAIL